MQIIEYNSIFSLHFDIIEQIIEQSKYSNQY